MNTLTRYQQSVIEFVRSHYDVQELSLDSYLDSQSTIGSIIRNDLRQYTIAIHSTLAGHVRDLILLHEYGHAYYGHLEINTKKEVNQVIHLINTISGSIYVHPRIAHKVINICQDIQINSTILSMKDNFELSKVYPGCTATGYDVEPGLDFREYYEPIIRYLDFKPDMDGQVTESTPRNPDIVFPNDVLPKKESELELEPPKLESEVEDTTLGDLDQLDAIQGIDGQGDSLGSNQTIQLDSEGYEDSLSQFVKSIPGDNGKSYHIKSDSLKLFNRKTRGNTNLMYSSTKRGRVKRELPRLGVVVDVSSSMHHHIVKNVLSQLRDLVRDIHPNSVLVTWNTNKVSKYEITSIPDNFLVSGGTDLAPSIPYLKNLGCSKILMISDFEDDISKINSECVDVELYAIRYRYNFMSDERDYFDQLECKRSLTILY